MRAITIPVIVLAGLITSTSSGLSLDIGGVGVNEPAERAETVTRGSAAEPERSGGGFRPLAKASSGIKETGRSASRLFGSAARRTGSVLSGVGRAIIKPLTPARRTVVVQDGLVAARSAASAPTRVQLPQARPERPLVLAGVPADAGFSQDTRNDQPLERFPLADVPEGDWTTRSTAPGSDGPQPASAAAVNRASTNPVPKPAPPVAQEPQPPAATVESDTVVALHADPAPQAAQSGVRTVGRDPQAPLIALAKPLEDPPVVDQATMHSTSWLWLALGAIGLALVVAWRRFRGVKSALLSPAS